MTFIAIFVWKFGGTSLCSAAKREAIYRHAARFIRRGHSIVLVVSAIGRYPDPYATDSLLAMTPHAGGHQKDRMAALGETISSLVVHSELMERGIVNEAIDTRRIGIITDDQCGGANIIACDASQIRQLLQKMPVVVVPGFQAISRQGHITTLGRGGSDLTALALADALQLHKVYIFTDVDGIYDADPRSHMEARHLPRVCYDDMLKLCDNGARVLYRQSVVVAKRHAIAVRVGCLTESKRCSWVTDC